MIGFPLTAAGIDVGSNAMRLIVAEFTAPSSFVSLAEQRTPVRLGASVFTPGAVLGDDIIQAAVDALAVFHQRMQSRGVQVYRATATSAVREAHNGRVLVDRVRLETGIELETITSGEEARLVWLAVSNKLPVAGRQWAFIDLGGGSVEIAHADGSVVLWSESHAMGAVRLLAELGPSARDPRHLRRLAGEYIDTLVSRIALDAGGLSGLVATGGNIEELARLGGAKPDETGIARLPLKDLRETIEKLAGMSAEERVARLRLRPDRADVVLPAALVYERIARLARVTELIVPHVGVKEGLLLDAVHIASGHDAHLDRQQREVLTGAIALGRRYLFNEAHARQVTRLAISLFDQLGGEMQLDDDDRLILLAAGILHDIGQYISYHRHHKHSFYLICNASLPDLTPRATLLVALVARYHRRAEPSPEHEGFSELDDDEQWRVTRLASLLRVADALDRQHRQHVVKVKARVADDRLRLTVTTRGDMDLEEWALEKKAQLITRVLGVRLAVTIRQQDESRL
ncbi:Ppx/GppA phosphatase family protein [soil metagenome]